MPRISDKIESVCSPSIGALSTFSLGKPEKSKGEPGVNILPIPG